MKTEELVKLLNNYPGFDVKVSISYINNSLDYPLCVNSYDVTGIDDIGHSDKSLQLEIKEQSNE